ncbi:hypothetical protein BS47DRAFT_1362547 [Hydnum rufescens UP504]|uniref:Uncharacterized protein n=1 Tax=Hydnum rufescens UP504 TaxID=1448309 RepID=A0A9P6AWR1_9AGAM|nr:hypothetical protein BS47DRAFT_1362547 [Hydnum rufescens UP504]
MTYPNKSPHLKSRTILNSNQYEPAEPNPATPNLPNECLPMNAHPTNAHPMNTRPTKTRHTNTTRPPKPNNPPNEHGPNSLPPNQTFQTTHLPKWVFSLHEDPPDEDIVYHTPASVGVWYYVPRCQKNQAQGKTWDHAATHTPDPQLPATYMRTKQIWRHTPASAGISTARYLTRQMHRPGPKQNMGLHCPHTPDPRFSATTKHETNMVPHTRQSGLSYNRYCLQHPPPLKTDRTPNEAREGTTHPLGQVCGATK